MEKNQAIVLMLETLENFTGIEQNQILSMVLKKVQTERLERQRVLQSDSHSVKIAIEDLDKMTREAVKY